MADKVEKMKYNYMENVLQHIIKTKISLSQEETKANNAILKTAVEQIINKLKEKSPLFKTLFQQTFYGGSYYDGLKVGKPEEYDLDLLLVLDKNCVVKPITEIPGFVTLEIESPTSEISDLMVNQYLSTEKVLQWMESITTKALQEFSPSGNQYIMNINEQTFYIKIVKSGPAFTLKINGNIKNEVQSFDVDLVPCFKFGPTHWPTSDFRKNEVVSKTDFFIVPKIPKKCSEKYSNISWRLSFQDQEREMISGSSTLKPAIKLLKKLRDKLQQTSISSYFIKTIFLWQVNSRPKNFWTNSLSYVFMEMLEVYAECLNKGEIFYYWNKSNNLLCNITDITLQNYANRVKKIISDVKRKEEPIYIATFYLSNEEIENMQTEIKICKKKSMEAEVLNITSDTRSIHANIAELNINSIKECEYAELKNMIQTVVLLLTDLHTKVDNLTKRMDNSEQEHRLYTPEKSTDNLELDIVVDALEKHHI